MDMEDNFTGETIVPSGHGLFSRDKISIIDDVWF
ncbi:unnamed protein product [Arabidopsis thaliana]|uniref:(thale cress) hypothetical protein n=1 Tax=Arabidopsis thaliana TaxID=3702 RepID=A0A7G2FCM7_ARATH|nr:unnamed protein product [Arabidopsis thaliana]